MKSKLRIEPVNLLGIFLLVIALTVAVIGYLNRYAGLYLGDVLSHLVTDFYANVSSGLAIVALTVLIIDKLNQRRANQRQKEALILQMGSPDNGFAIEAIRILRNRGWLTDGSLEGKNFNGAN